VRYPKGEVRSETPRCWVLAGDQVRARQALKRVERFKGEHAVTEAVLKEAQDDPVPEPMLLRMSTVRREHISWVWPNRIARGKLSLLIGDPGVGKSTLAIDIAAKITRGTAWPDGPNRVESSGVLILSAEDGVADTIARRLDNAGADSSKVCVLPGIRNGKTFKPLALSSDLQHLEVAIEAERQPLSSLIRSPHTWDRASTPIT
jgi:hypothetical protein